MDSTVAVDIFAAANQILPLQGCSFLADKGYDAKSIYNTVKTVYDGKAFIPLNPCGTKASEAISAGNPIREAGLTMHKDGKTTLPVCGLLLPSVLLIDFVINTCFRALRQVCPVAV